MAWVRALRRELDAETVVCRERESRARGRRGEKHQPKPTSRFFTVTSCCRLGEGVKHYGAHKQTNDCGAHMHTHM